VNIFTFSCILIPPLIVACIGILLSTPITMSTQLNRLIAFCEKIGFPITYCKTSAKFYKDPASYYCTSFNIGDFEFVSPLGNRHLELWYIRESKICVALDEKKHGIFLRCLKMILLIHDQGKVLKRSRGNGNIMEKFADLPVRHPHSRDVKAQYPRNSTTRLIHRLQRKRCIIEKYKEYQYSSQSGSYAQSRKRKRKYIHHDSRCSYPQKRTDLTNSSDIDHEDVSAALLLCSISEAP